MRKTLTFLLVMLCISVSYATTDIHTTNDPLLKRFITNNKWLPNQSYQQELRSLPAWQNFTKNNGEWWVQFNETNRKPHRAFGAPIALNLSGTPQAAGLYFINNYLQAFIPSSINLEFTGATVSKKYIQPNYTQYYNGLEILWSRVTVKMSPDYKVVMFGADVYDDLTLSTTPQLSLQDAISFASNNIPGNITAINADPALKILPIPEKFSNSYKLVYAITVSNINFEKIPAQYYTLVDANTGEIVYRDNRVNHFGNNDVNVTGTGYPTNPYNPSQNLNLQYIKLNVGGTNYFTDVNGFLSLNNSGTVSATIYLAGKWAEIYTGAAGNTLVSTPINLAQGPNTFSFNSSTSIRHISAYYHTNIVHDFMKTYLPSFTALDFPLSVKVDRTDGTCNAFYDGGTNFYTTAGGCNALSIVADVVYHEFGHGITNRFWGANGSSFSNGAMGEGYSDTWAMSITSDPILGIGFSSTDPNTAVRRYDFPNGDPRKVYPADIVGEVHSDGEIICGAWWSTALQLGSVPTMTAIFTESHNGLANGANGSEGQVYCDILVDALFADDNDANIQNGTPNIVAISTAFAQHGITLLSNANLNHTPVQFVNGNSSVVINANLTNLLFAWALQGVSGAYRLNNSTTWNNFSMTSPSLNNYTFTIPAQPNGTVIAYYLYTTDINGYASNVTPTAANDPDPNIPYYTMVGYDKIFTEDFDLFAGPWTEGVPSDDAVTGIWQQDIPELTSVSGNPVQPDFQVTPGGTFCYVTGQAAGTAPGFNDVDSGKTTLISPVFDLTGYENPAFEYYRWYTNDQGADPGQDHWQVSISNDGINYIPVENTNVADHSWRRFVFRIKDYVSTSSTVTVKFIAEDASPQSLVEALMDDFSLYDQQAVGINELNDFVALSVWPNPASDKLKIDCMLNQTGNYKINILNNLGQVVYSSTQKLITGNQKFEIPVNTLSNGIYEFQMQGPTQQKTQKISIVR